MNPQEIQNLRLWFDSIDADKGGTIEAHELAGLSIDGIPLGLDVAIAYVKAFDKDGNGRIDFWEYCALHKMLLTFRNAFVIADQDKSGTLQANEIHSALVQSGFSYLSYNTIVELLHKYDPQKLGLNYHSFLLLAAQVSRVRSLFEWYDVNRSGVVTLSLDQLNSLVSKAL